MLAELGWYICMCVLCEYVCIMFVCVYYVCMCVSYVYVCIMCVCVYYVYMCVLCVYVCIMCVCVYYVCMVVLIGLHGSSIHDNKSNMLQEKQIQEHYKNTTEILANFAKA